MSVFVLFSLVFLVPSDAFGAWYDTEWEYRNKITVSLNSVISSDLSDFPVLIKFTHNDLKQANESMGRDFVFTASDGTTKLFHEIEYYDNTTGEIIAWVNFPTLVAASSTDIYIYYKGNTVGFNSADVWNDDYVVVWHLNQTSTGTSYEFKDSTSNGNDGRGGGGGDVGHDSQRIPHLTDGQIGKGQHLKGPTTTGNGEGTGDIIYRNSLDGMPSRDFTIELWTADITNVPSGGNAALYNDLVSVCYDAGSTNNQWQNHISLWQSANVKMKIRTNFFVSTANPGHPVQDDNPAAFTNWNHIVAVYNQKDADGTQGNSQLYINGVLVKDENRSGGLNRNIQTDNLRMVLGGDIDAQGGNNCGSVNNELKGKVDELRISSGLRTADYAAASYFNQGDPSTYLSLGGQETQIIIEEIKKSDSCYDCEAPKLTKVEVHITSNTSEDIVDDNSPQISETRDYVWTFDQDTPYPMFGDGITPIVADPGDDVEIILELTDNRTLKRVYDSATYTNFLTKPHDMNTFYANNFDEFGKVSTTYYEWHQTGEDLVYDYSNTVQWSEADVTIQESGEFVKDGTAENLDALVGTFTISFKMKFLEPMNTSDVWVQATDRSGNFFKVSLPLTLKITGNEPLVFESRLNQKVLSFYDDDILSKLISKWDGSSQNVVELGTILGIPDESLPSWITNLATWVVEDRITIADMIVAIEHIINN
ncbi:MAG: DUF2341 domain-containing protein [Nitrosopumilus sp.]